MKDSDLSQFEIEEKDLKLCIKREQPGGAPVIMQAPAQPVAAAQPTASAQAAAPEGQAAPPVDDGTTIIKSPMVGTFYRSPSPDSAPFIEVGQRVKADSVVCIIEAMKVMNEIQSEISGEIIEILVENEASVEYGQPLIKIKPS